MLVILQNLFVLNLMTEYVLRNIIYLLFYVCVKMAPILKKESRNHKNNYRTVSILPVVSKKFEKIMKK